MKWRVDADEMVGQTEKADRARATAIWQGDTAGWERVTALRLSAAVPGLFFSDEEEVGWDGAAL